MMIFKYFDDKQINDFLFYFSLKKIFQLCRPTSLGLISKAH